MLAEETPHWDSERMVGTKKASPRNRAAQSSV
jgi:hypothetical protein